MHHPALLILMMAAALWVGKLWLDDRRATSLGATPPGCMPGATPASGASIVIAVAGALLLVAVETAGEAMLSISVEQSVMTWLFAAYAILAAPIIEETVFRGWLVIEDRGTTVRWLAATVASAAFAIMHPFLWEWDDGLHWTPGLKAWFSTGVVFCTSLWLYVARFAPWNPTRSLLPCILAHAAKNAGVVAVKAGTGFISGPW